MKAVANERCAPWQKRVGLDSIKAAVVDDIENRKALVGRLHAYLDAQAHDPWQARVADADKGYEKFTEYKAIDIPVRVETV